MVKKLASFIGTILFLFPSLALADTATFYPSLDGRVFRDVSSSTFSSLRDGDGNGAISNDSSSSFFELEDSGAALYKSIMRSVFQFDTSALPDDAVITSVTFSVTGTAKADNLGVSPSIGVYGATINGTVDITDYENIGDTSYVATPISYASWNTSGVNTFTFNSTGEAAVSLTGVTDIALRNANFDGDNSAFTASGLGDQASYMQGYYSEQGGTGDDPVLVVNYTIGGGDTGGDGGTGGLGGEYSTGSGVLTTGTGSTPEFMTTVCAAYMTTGSGSDIEVCTRWDFALKTDFVNFAMVSMGIQFKTFAMYLLKYFVIGFLLSCVIIWFWRRFTQRLK